MVHVVDALQLGRLDHDTTFAIIALAGTKRWTRREA